jgi:hypothetical protein
VLISTVPGCAGAGVSEVNQAPRQCTGHVEGSEAFIECSDGSHFQAPAKGGIGYGFDMRGHDLDAYVSVVDGKYFVSASPAR